MDKIQKHTKNVIIDKEITMHNKDAEFYRDAAYDLLGQWKWADSVIKKLLDKLQVAHDHNIELLDRVHNLESGHTEEIRVPQMKSRHRDHNPNNKTRTIATPFGRKEIQVRGYEYTTVKDLGAEKPPQVLTLETILSACSTYKQRQIAQLYFDKDSDAYNSQQKVAEYVYPDDKYGRQKVNSVLNTIEENLKPILVENIK